MEIKEAMLKQQWQQMLEGKDVVREELKLKDCTHFETPNPDLDGETVLMERHVARSKSKRGHLDWESLILYPIMVGDEYNMTHGAFHERNDSEDYIWCESGNGLLMFMDRNGGCWCEELEEGSLHHIEEDLAIRLINTGDEALIVAHCFPSEAGRDEESVKAMPFPCHVYEDDGEMCMRVDLPTQPKEEAAEITFEDLSK